MSLFRVLCLTLVLVAPVSAQEVAERLAGHLIEDIPNGPGPFPGILAIPGCSGISLNSPETDAGGGSPTDPYFRRHYPRMAKALSDEGYAVFSLDYQSAEGVVSACLGEVHPTRIAEYIEVAARQITADPRVQTGRVFLIGWSLGGAGLLHALDPLDDAELNISDAIAIYPRCVGVMPWSSTIPVHLFLGEADEITPAETCRALVWKIEEHLPVIVRSYPGARHGFDIGEASAEISTGRGTTIGFNQAATEDTWQRIREIMSGG